MQALKTNSRRRTTQEMQLRCDMCGSKHNVQDVGSDKLCKWCRQARKMRDLGPLSHGLSQTAYQYADAIEDN